MHICTTTLFDTTHQHIQALQASSFVPAILESTDVVEQSVCAEFDRLSALAHLTVRANSNLDIQLCILIFVALNGEELVEQIIQAAMDSLCVHEEAGVSTLDSPSYVPYHVLLGFWRLVVLECAHLKHFGAVSVKHRLVSMIGAEQQAVR